MPAIRDSQLFINFENIVNAVSPDRLRGKCMPMVLLPRRAPCSSGTERHCLWAGRQRGSKSYQDGHSLFIEINLFFMVHSHSEYQVINNITYPHLSAPYVLVLLNTRICNLLIFSKIMSMEIDFLRRSVQCSILTKIRNNVLREKHKY
jgi:hypothetical protein